MKRILNANLSSLLAPLWSRLKLWHAVLAVTAALAIGTGGVGMAGRPTPLDGGGDSLAPVAADAFWKSGQLRMAASSSNNPINVPGDDDITVLTAAFKVAAGKKVDIAAFFNAEANWNGTNGGYCWAEFRLDNPSSGTKFFPGQLWVVDGNVFNDHWITGFGDFPTISLNGFLQAIGPGNHTVYVVMNANGDGCTLSDRSLILIGNFYTP